nr:hypothetical protein Iba_chr02bCG4480 [Ipomoea batatas]
MGAISSQICKPPKRSHKSRQFHDHTNMHETRTTQKLRKESRQGFEQNLTGKTDRVGYLDFEGDMLRGLEGARMATSGLRVLENQTKIAGRIAPDF